MIVDMNTPVIMYIFNELEVSGLHTEQNSTKTFIHEQLLAAITGMGFSEKDFALS
jgi:hypothetical protein